MQDRNNQITECDLVKENNTREIAVRREQIDLAERAVSLLTEAGIPVSVKFDERNHIHIEILSPEKWEFRKRLVKRRLETNQRDNSE